MPPPSRFVAHGANLRTLQLFPFAVVNGDLDEHSGAAHMAVEQIEVTSDWTAGEEQYKGSLQG